MMPGARQRPPCLSMKWPETNRQAARGKATTQANPSTTPSTWMSAALGRFFHVLVNHRVADSDNNTPPAPPARQISKLSIICDRMSVSRCAPSALRMAISFCRAAPRATSRLATFRQPISSMQATAHIRISSGFFTSRARSSFRVAAPRLRPPAIRYLQMEPVLHCLYLAQGAGQANIRPQTRDHRLK